MSGYDSARVAKFEFAASIETYSGTSTGTTYLTATGVNIDLFTTSFDSADGTLTDPITTVASGDSDKVIAPGVYGAFEFAVSGESEVATRLTLTIKETDGSGADTTIPLFYQYGGKYYANNTAITQYGTKLTAGDIYINISNSDATPYYHQIDTAHYGGNLTALAAAVVADAATTLTGSTTTTVIPPNTDLSAFTATVDWYWPFEVVEVGDALSTDYDVTDGFGYYRLLSDTNDTALGIDAADITTAANWVKLEIGATLTQVD